MLRCCRWAALAGPVSLARVKVGLIGHAAIMPAVTLLDVLIHARDPAIGQVRLWAVRPIWAQVLCENRCKGGPMAALYRGIDRRVR